MKSIEHAEQVLLMQWWALSHQQFGIPEQLLFAIPNGGERNIIVAARMKKEGVRAGVPDLFLAVPRGEFHGLFIEMKKPKGGRVSKNQSSMMKLLAAQGYASKVCCGWVEARVEIERYLRQQPNAQKVEPETT
jgi:hypothetical protein